MKGLFEVTRRAACIVDGTPAPYVENDLDEDGLDTNLPPGWVKLTLSRVVINPAYVEEEARLAQLVEVRAQIVEQQVAGQAQGQPQEVLDQVREQAAMVLDMQIPMPDNDEPQFIVETFEYAIAPANLGVLAPLELDGFGPVEAGG